MDMSDLKDSPMESGDWRVQSSASLRPRVVNRILDTLERLLSYSGDEGYQELKEIAVMIEEKIYIHATSQTDYLRKISLKILAMETRSQGPIPRVYIKLSSIANSLNLPYGGDDQKEKVNPYKRDPMCEIVGPMTRARTKRRNNSLSIGAVNENPTLER